MGFADALIQTNSLVDIYGSVFNAPPVWTTAVLVVLTACVILGGVRKIAAFCKWLVPFMAVLYILLCAAVIVTNLENCRRPSRAYLKARLPAPPFWAERWALP